ncbi:MAG TPA: hypothetical protein VHJ17_11480 [Thermomonospora sp.]|nr:hypothetical protein [Thermomonospora sp.]
MDEGNAPFRPVKSSRHTDAQPGAASAGGAAVTENTVATETTPQTNDRFMHGDYHPAGTTYTVPSHLT